MSAMRSSVFIASRGPGERRFVGWSLLEQSVDVKPKGPKDPPEVTRPSRPPSAVFPSCATNRLYDRLRTLKRSRWLPIGGRSDSLAL